MAKPKILRIYEANPILPMGWTFPMLIVVLKTMSRLGVAVAQPIAPDGKLSGKRVILELKMTEKHYHLMHKRKADKVLTHDEMETMLLTQ